MRSLKIPFILSLILSMFAFSGVSAFAESENLNSIDMGNNGFSEDCNIHDFISEADEKQAQINEDGSKTIKITDSKTLEEIESTRGKKYPDKKLREIEIKLFPEAEIQDHGDLVTPQALASVKQTGLRDACGANLLRKSTGTGTFSMSISESVTTQVSGGLGVNIKVINASLGTSISSTVTVTDSTSYTAPKGEIGVIEAYPSLKILDYDAYYAGVKTGSGNVTYAVGVCWNKYY
ncbi:hypothetical protein MUB24_17205 [Lederbergia sp. NSJ-179]|uniref:hypothetical protein n=1 Tax=Lederbergia sp. NSJ-179 TaxID=2931402 RepID=UPI001FD3828C|nr:hypothetical protein [Lederbergia sp. NSJ-179]MCJ7842603.1 hypothetical protein [Lederbergia sp. NSJ-179]